MPHPDTYTFCRLIGLGVFLLLVVGCRGDVAEEDLEWTVENGTLTLEQDLVVGDDEDYYFGNIDDVDVRGDGRIYVADGEAMHIKVLAPDGTLQDSIGRVGEGPGEFEEGPRRVRLARGDSIYVQERYRISVFAPSHRFERRFRLSRLGGSPRFFLVPNQQAGYAAQFSVFITYGQTDPGRRHALRLTPSGGLADTLFTLPPPEIYVHEGDNLSMMIIPFSPSAHVALGPKDRAHYAWGDRLRVVSYTFGGEPQDTVTVPFEPVPVTEEDLDRVTDNLPTSPEKTGLLQEIPSTKPAFTQFLVDDEGQYWFGRPTATPDSTEWWMVDREEKRVATTMLPSDVELDVVVDRHAYGRTTTEAGAPLLLRYRIQPTSN